MITCRVCKGTKSMRVLVCVGGPAGGINIETSVPCTECGGSGVGGVRDLTPDEIRAMWREAFAAPAPKNMTLWNDAASHPGRSVRLR